MKLKDFRKLINDPELKEDYDVLMSSDEEGNSFSHVYEINVVNVQHYKKTNTFNINEPNEKKSPNAVLIWPC
jgi:hypothetical protein